jgi:hypothetical protein
MNKTSAIQIVQSVNPSANELIINDLLEDSKGIKSGVPAYRPYIVAAKTLSLNPPNADLKKAEDVEWFDWQRRIKELISTQLMADVTIDEIPIGWLADNGEIIPLAAISSTQIF